VAWERKQKRLNTTALRHYPELVSIPTMLALNAYNPWGTPMSETNELEENVCVSTLPLLQMLHWSRCTTTCVISLQMHLVPFSQRSSYVLTQVPNYVFGRTKMRATKFFVSTAKREHEMKVWMGQRKGMKNDENTKEIIQLWIQQTSQPVTLHFGVRHCQSQ
jgi:hypothetical protein